MSAPETAAVMNALGGSDMARFVGGCVRNALLGKEVVDIDIATRHKPEEVMQKLREQNIKVIPTGIDHGTVTAVVNKKHFEITTLRHDVETDGRRATVAYTDDWLEDAKRRDFTMNTLLADDQGNIYDPTGDGLNDLRARRVVFVGAPEKRIAEDYLRILRLFRFHVFYGRGDIDSKALKACANAAGKIETLSKERITQEFFKILSADKPHEILNVMFEHNVLSQLNFQDYDAELMEHACEFQSRYSLGFIASRLLVLCAMNASNVKAAQTFLLVPKVFQKDMVAISNVLSLPDLDNDHAVKVAIYKYGRVPTAQALMIELANDRVMNGYAPKALDIVQNWDIPSFPISGQDLMDKGLKPSPELGAELDRLESEWIDSGFSNPT